MWDISKSLYKCVCRVDWLVTEHLSALGRQAGVEGRASLVLVSKQNLDTSDTLTIVENGLEIRKLWPHKVKGSRTQKNKPHNTTKAGSQTPKKFLVCCFVASRVQRLFVKFHVALL
jgi:hypothetical protein